MVFDPDELEKGNCVLTLYAEWEKSIYKLTYDKNCNDTVTGMPETNPVDVPCGEKLTNYPLEREGYTFLGWYEDKTCTTKWDFDTGTMPASDKTLYAGWFGNNIHDDVDGMVKKDVVITNTGTVKGYIRVAITANWYKDGSIVAPWSITDISTGKCSQGEFEGLTGTGWTKVGDYWYYTYPVDKAEELKGTNALFDKYEFTNDEIPEGADHLEMQIMVQSVIWDKDKAEVTKAWGSTAAGYLNAEKPKN